MNTNIYLSLIPEALVASMMPPEAFGNYMATGTEKRPHGQAAFFEIKSDLLGTDYFDLAGVRERCVPHADGSPKHSVYVAIYRALEHVPLEAIGNLYLATAHGRVLQIEQGEIRQQTSEGYHLYQELCPVSPLIASSLAPAGFCGLITDPSKPIRVPRICFVELDLGDLAEDPAHGGPSGLPYPNFEHIRDCLCELKPLGDKETKTVDRIGRRGLIYRSVKIGFYVGDRERVLHYPYPSREDLEGKHYAWWHCANDAELEHSAFAG